MGNSRNWSKGLTKETSQSVKKMAETLSKNTSGKQSFWYGKKHTEESKEKMSERRINYLENNDNHSKWYLFNNGERNIKVQGTWEKRFAEYIINNNIKWNRFAIKYDGHRRYTPDFYLLDFDIYIEVKGWMKDRDIDKMHRFLKDHPNCDIRLVDSLDTFKKLENNLITILELEKFIDKYS